MIEYGCEEREWIMKDTEDWELEIEGDDGSIGSVKNLDLRKDNILGVCDCPEEGSQEQLKKIVDK